jgi:hypothetical protein
MTDPFEARLERTLDHAARQLEVSPQPWRGTAASGRQRPRFERLTLLAGVAVAVLVAVFAVVLIGHRHPVSPAAGTLPPASPAAFEPHLTPSQLNAVLAAYRKVTTQDRGCRSLSGPELTSGRPSPELTSLFSILREPASSGEALRGLLERERGPALQPAAEYYVNQIHAARAAFGGTFYVLPAGNITGQRGVAARCQAEQVTALKQRLSRTKPSLRNRMLAAQARYLAYMRYLARHPEGICAAWLTRPVKDEGTLMCGSVANFERWGIMAVDSNQLHGRPVFWTVVPDVVATATLHFTPDGTPLRHPVTMTVRPVGNFVVAVVPHGRFGARGAWADAFPSTIVLRDRNGQVIRRDKVTPSMPTDCGFGC